MIEEATKYWKTSRLAFWEYKVNRMEPEKGKRNNTSSTNCIFFSLTIFICSFPVILEMKDGSRGVKKLWHWPHLVGLMPSSHLFQIWRDQNCVDLVCQALELPSWTYSCMVSNHAFISDIENPCVSHFTAVSGPLECIQTVSMHGRQTSDSSTFTVRPILSKLWGKMICL